MKHSLAWRITLVLTALITLAVALAALLAFYVYREMEEGMIDKLIQTESARLIVRTARMGDVWQQPFERDMGPSMFVWGESAEREAASMPPELRALPLGLHELPREESSWRVSVAPAKDGRLYVLYDSIMLEQQSRNFAFALVLIVLGCSLLALLISSTGARWLVTPLNTLTTRLTRWAPGTPISDVASTNEANRLLEVFNRVQDQVDTAIADQREFSANLHHEIRTPLTVIQSDAELLLRLTANGAELAPPRLRRIVRSVQDIKQSLESTYNLAHAHMDDAETVDLRSCVQDIFETLRLEAEQTGLNFENKVNPAHRETLNRYALLTVMRNIVRNALLHAAPARLEVESAQHGLHFTDTGPGIDPAEQPAIFERYFSNRRLDQRLGSSRSPELRGQLDQSGLGLAIAKRVCIVQEWTLEVQSPVSQGRGTRFLLYFREDAESASHSRSVSREDDA
ncbi:MAG: HAMP domain-containing histidine kinase [Pigmentiphaga sp.]|nr:HAMP domain-containing histidine kinase [Pigmentiphaga sp.]